MKNKAIAEVLQKYELTVESVFVPWSKSRNAGEKFPSLNWKVTLKQGGRAILTTDYSAGCGHAPSYKQRMYNIDWQIVRAECEFGYAHKWSDHHNKPIPMFGISKTMVPDEQNVIYSLLMDSDVMDYGEFEDWAASLGYDQDSREAEKTYQACLKIALRLNSGLSSAAMNELKEVYQDY